MAEPTPPPLTLRAGNRCYAVEPGRRYALGSAQDNDLPLRGLARYQAEVQATPTGLWLGVLQAEPPVLRNGLPTGSVELQPGDLLQLGPHQLVVGGDEALAELLPLPADRLQAQQRRYAAVRLAATQARREAPTFASLLAQELQRAPWLGLSVVLHLLLLLLLWWVLPTELPRPSGRATLQLADQSGQSTLLETMPQLPEVAAEAPVAEPLEPPAADAAPPLPPLAVPAERQQLRENPHLGRLVGPAPRRGTDRGTLLAGSSPGFQRQVAELRRTGFELVFVFDSTGSMGRTILDTKNTIAVLLAVLRELVPEARVGIVTYRDEGPREAYVTRSLPLGTDYWRAANFVQSVSADGGGDRPEAVRQGLEAAFAMDFQPGSRRVVVLAGDAPPHERDVAELLRAVRNFAKPGQSVVHTLVTASDMAGKDTQQHFQRIAEAGRGECRDLADYHHVLRNVLMLAFGRQFAGDLQQIIAAVEADSMRSATWAMDLARRGGAMLAAELAHEPVSHELLHALVRMPRRRTSLELVELLAAVETAETTRQAISWVLQRQLDLGLPPLPAEAHGPPPSKVIDRLRRLAKKLDE